MVVDERDYLAIWLGYWRKFVPDGCLHILCHGENQALQELAEGVRFDILPRPDPYPEMEDDRWKMLADTVSALTHDGLTVVYTDVDEIIVADPRRGGKVVDKLMAVDAPAAHTLGLEIIHRMDQEPEPIRTDKPILRQRQYFRTTSFYSKPCIVTAPVRWGRGGHFANSEKLRIVSGLYTIHLRFYDMNYFRERALIRRTTTDLPARLKAIPHRRWRNSAEGTEDLIEELHAMKLPKFRSVFTMPLVWRIWLSRRKRPDETGLYRYALFANGLQRLPCRFLDLV